jgi:flagellar M-ring protein FliF
METPKLGTSQFLEQVNFQRALEGELARSIQSVSAINGARVHLAIPKPSVFLREQQKPSASVIVNLHPARTLEPGQVSAIVHLVSSSVPELQVKNVTVVDQNGNLLSTPGDDRGIGLDPSQLKYVKEMEHGFAQRIESILAPVVGAENVHAQVTADIDFTQTEQAEESYRPNQGSAPAAVRSLNSSESASGAPGSQAGGVPGALSNQPPAPAAAPITGQPANGAQPTAASAAPTNLHKDSSISYEVDKSLKHIRSGTGNVKRLSVAVVVNHRKLTAKDGRVSMKPRTEEEMAQINKLVREAMGFTEGRGDTVTVANTPFNVGDPEPVEQIPFWKQPAIWALAQEIGKNLLIAGVFLFLFLKVLRPMFKSALTVRPQAGAGAMQALPATEGGDNPSGRQRSLENNLQSAKQIAQQDPKLVANIVRTWVSGQ